MINRDPTPKNTFRNRAMVTGLAASAAFLAACDSGESTQATSSTPSTQSSEQLPSSTPSSEIPSDATSVTIEAPSTSPSETSASSSEVETPDTSMGISVERYKTPEQIGERLGKVIDEWHNAGSHDDIMSAYRDRNKNLSVEQASAAEAAKLDELYVAGLFSPTAQNDQKTAAVIKGLEKSHNDTLYRKTLTTDSYDSRDKEPYARTVEIVDITPVSNEGNSVSLTVKYHESDNPDMNRIGTEYGAGKLDAVNTLAVTLEQSNGHWLITEADYLDQAKQQ